MKKNEIRIIESLPFTQEETLSLSDMNKITGGGICIKYSIVVVGDCLITKCGIKIGCIGKAKKPKPSSTIGIQTLGMPEISIPETNTNLDTIEEINDKINKFN